jgi:hemin uptake protein HemP
MSHSDDGQANTGPRVLPLPIQGSSAPAGQRIVDSRDLLAGHSSLLIRHLGEVYRLQTTRQGKLILTK